MVSDILRPGNKVEIEAVQKIERQGSTGGSSACLYKQDTGNP